MKRALWFVMLIPVLLTAQELSPEMAHKLAEGMASAHVAAAHSAEAESPSICLADISTWEKRDAADQKAKKHLWWYQLLSTEELIRLDNEAARCIGRPDIEALYSSLFQRELLSRAEAVLRDNQLLNEYLMRPTLQ
jgi:hypothetical protein